jgi:hypothetical protein
MESQLEQSAATLLKKIILHCTNKIDIFSIRNTHLCLRTHSTISASFVKQFCMGHYGNRYDDKYKFNKICMCVISGFRRDVDEICAVLGY